jgi:hypothetical protein
VSRAARRPRSARGWSSTCCPAARSWRSRPTPRRETTDQVLAADDRITAWALELRKAGLEGGTDELRARAYLDLLLGQDSRPVGSPSGAPGAAPAGFASRATLTAPLVTLTRDLAAAAGRNPKTTWCLTVTDNQGHAIGHGCARPEPKSHRKRAGPGPPGFCFTPSSRDGPPGSGYGT